MKKRILGLIGTVLSGVIAYVLMMWAYVYESAFLVFISIAIGACGVLCLCEALEGTKLLDSFTPKDEEDEL